MTELVKENADRKQKTRRDFRVFCLSVKEKGLVWVKLLAIFQHPRLSSFFERDPCHILIAAELGRVGAVGAGAAE